MVEIELHVTDITLCDKTTNEVINLKEYHRISFKQCQQIAKENNSVLVNKKTTKQTFFIDPNHLTKGT